MQSQEEEDFLKQDAEEIMRGKPYHWRDWSIVLDEDCLYLWSDAAVLELRKDSNGWFRFVLDENLTTMYFGGTYGNSPDESRREFLEKLLAVQSQMQTGLPSQPILSAPDATRLVVGNWSLSCIHVGKISVQNSGKLKETITLYENCPGFKFQSNVTLGKIPFIAEISLGPEFPAGWAKMKEKRFNAKSKLEDSKQKEENFLKQDAEEIMSGKPYHWRDWSIVLDEDLYLWSDAAVIELRKDSNGWFRFVIDRNLTTMYFGGTYGVLPDESRREFLQKLLAVQSQMQTGLPSQPILSAPDATRLVVGNWSLSCICVGKISLQNSGKLKETITLYENCPGFKFQSNVTLGKIPFIAEVSLGPEFPAGWAKRKEKRFNAKSKLEDLKQKSNCSRKFRILRQLGRNECIPHIEEELKEINQSTLFTLPCSMFSLEKICFNLIVQTFQRFYCAFTESKDENVQRNFRFLQRRFSVQLLTALYVDKTLKEEYFELLINQHVNIIVGKWFKKSRYLTSMEYIFCRVPNLTRICFKNCGDEILKNVAKFCPKIIEIDVRYSKVTDDGVKYLYDMRNGRVSCPELKNLFIKSSLVTDSGAECLIRNLPSLEKFDYPNLPLLLHSINKNNVTFILRKENVHKYNIVELNLSKIPELSYYNDVLKTCLTVCPKLESIACYIKDTKQLDLFKNSHLKKLSLLFWLNKQCPIINLNNFLKTNGCNLISLKISNPAGIGATNCNMSVFLLSVHCPALREFYAHNLTFTDDDDDEVFFPSLTKCCFSCIDPSGAKAICFILSSSPKLESVSFRFMYELPLEVKNEILMWVKSRSAKLIEFAHIFFEKEFIKDILVDCLYLKAMFLKSCYSDSHDVKSFLHSLSEKQCIKPKIFVEEYDPYMCDVEERRALNFLNHESIFNENIRNLENYLKEEYKCSNVYDFLFPETAFHGYDNWEANWEVISD